jgi:SAM-dependent methyltransferase
MKRFYKALNDSPWLAAKVTIDRVMDQIQERRLGLHSSGLIPIETMIRDWQGNHDYAPTSFRAFRAFMVAVEVENGREVFVDYGCGMGRTLALASEYPFSRVIGVEVSPYLADIARRNIANYRGRRLCEDIQVWNGSADQFEIPEDASIFYFFNPFHGQTLANVFDKISRSLEANPRRLQIIFNNPVHFEKLAARYSWLRVRRRFSLEHHCLIYESLNVSLNAQPGTG